jgi:hypothetical protein
MDEVAKGFNFDQKHLGRTVHGDRQPQVQPAMKAGLEALQIAKGHLQAATPDKGGHRVKAIALTQAAIDEVKKGIAFDNHN